MKTFTITLPDTIYIEIENKGLNLGFDTMEEYLEHKIIKKTSKIIERRNSDLEEEEESEKFSQSNIKERMAAFEMQAEILINNFKKIISIDSIRLKDNA